MHKLCIESWLGLPSQFHSTDENEASLGALGTRRKIATDEMAEWGHGYRSGQQRHSIMQKWAGESKRVLHTTYHSHNFPQHRTIGPKVGQEVVPVYTDIRKSCMVRAQCSCATPSCKKKKKEKPLFNGILSVKTVPTKGCKLIC